MYIYGLIFTKYMNKKFVEWKLPEIWFLSIGIALVAGSIIEVVKNYTAVFISGIILLSVGAIIRAVRKK